MIIGITDSKNLGLINVNFDAIEKESSIKVVHNVESDNFKKQIESEFSDLFQGIGWMDCEISIKLHEDTIPHTEPIRHVPHAMQKLFESRTRQAL